MLPAATIRKDIRHLAGLYGIQSSYRDALGQRRQASPEAMLAVLRSLGASIHQPADVAAASARREEELGTRFAQSVYVVWGNSRPRFLFNVPQSAAAETVAAELRSETGETIPWPIPLAAGKVLDHHDFGGRVFVTVQVEFQEKLPAGYHRLRGAIAGQPFDSLVIVAPRKAYPPGPVAPEWGVFLPVYALHSAGSWGAGDYADLNTLVNWTSRMGGSAVATLPLLPAFLDAPYDPSPYAPVSRLFWNDFFIRPELAPEFEGSPAARELVAGAEFQATLADLRGSPHVDYRRTSALKRKVLALMAERFFHDGVAEARRPAYENFLRVNAAVQDYSRFRARVDTRGVSWPQWESSSSLDGDSDASRAHLYAQFLAQEQLGVAAATARKAGRGLYLDLPLGVHFDSYDVWRNQALFALDMAVGAPPDPFFTKGQNWGFPPLAPAPNRAQHYAFTIAYIRHHLQFCGVLRIDHVMAIHRLFWIPKGMEATDGVYVHYPSEELYAILSVESHRHKAWIVGENLGTVPEAVNRELRAHNIQRLYVFQYEVQPKEHPLGEVTEDVIAGLNTHDMPTFESFRTAADVADRVDMGLLDAQGAKAERERRNAILTALTDYFNSVGIPISEPTQLVDAALHWLATSKARMLLVNLEDLWGEPLPQNTPGTVNERPNWSRKTKYTLEEIMGNEDVVRILTDLTARRRPA
jgi:4-alpha-glucanotransferase